jgi:hypothetical protein
MPKTILRFLLLFCILVQVLPAVKQDIADKCEDNTEQTAEKKVEEPDSKWLIYNDIQLHQLSCLTLSASNHAHLQHFFFTVFISDVQTPPPDQFAVV